VDSTNQIDESNKANNQCKFAFTANLQPASPAQITERAQVSRVPPGIALRTTPKFTMGINAVKLSQTFNTTKTKWFDFDPPRQGTSIDVGYGNFGFEGGETRVWVRLKNIGPGTSVPVTAGGVVAGGVNFKGLNSTTVPALKPGQTYAFEWNVGVFTKSAFTVTISLK